MRIGRVTSPLQDVWRLGGHVRRDEFSHLVVDKWKQFGRRSPVAGRGGVHEVGYLGHGGGLYEMRRHVHRKSR